MLRIFIIYALVISDGASLLFSFLWLDRGINKIIFRSCYHVVKSNTTPASNCQLTRYRQIFRKLCNFFTFDRHLKQKFLRILSNMDERKFRVLIKHFSLRIKMLEPQISFLDTMEIEHHQIL